MQIVSQQLPTHVRAAATELTSSNVNLDDIVVTSDYHTEEQNQQPMTKEQRKEQELRELYYRRSNLKLRVDKDPSQPHLRDILQRIESTAKPAKSFDVKPRQQIVG